MMGIGAVGMSAMERYHLWQPSMVRVAAPRAQLETPVQPVRPAQTVSAENGAAKPLGRSLPLQFDFDPAEMAVRARIQYPEDAEAAEEAELSKEAETAKEAQEHESLAETTEEAECQTCKRRKYQDGSDDPGVSFKTPSHIAPEQAAAKVRGHEMEHVVREQAKAAREDRKVVSQSVTMHTAICPECGRVYVSGGTTRTTTTANTPKPELYEQKEDAGKSNFQTVA